MANDNRQSKQCVLTLRTRGVLTMHRYTIVPYIPSALLCVIPTYRIT